MLARALVEAGLPAGILNVVTGYAAKTGRRPRHRPARADDQLHRRRPGGRGDREEGRAQEDRHGARLQHARHRLRGLRPQARRRGLACRAPSGPPGRTASASSASTSRRAIYKRFETLFVARTRKYKVGPKLDEDCDMGPMINEGEAKRIERWVEGSGEGGREGAHRRQAPRARSTSRPFSRTSRPGARSTSTRCSRRR